MVLFITYLRPSLQKEKKTRPWSPPNKTLSRLTTITDWPYQFVLAFKTVHYSAQHFLNFFVKQHHHRSRYWQNNNKFGISSSKIKTTTNTAAASAHTERMEFGRGLKQLVMPRPLPKLLEIGRRNTTTNHYYYKNTNVIMIVFCCLILIFFW